MFSIRYIHFCNEPENNGIKQLRPQTYASEIQK